MKTIIQITCLILSLSFAPLGMGQNLYAPQTHQHPSISVSGTAEKEVTPNEIYISILLEHRQDSKKKKSIDQLDSELRAALSKHGVDPNTLYLSDAESNRIHLRRKKPLIQSLQYSIMVHTAKETEQIFSILNDLNIKNASISKISHSNIEELRKEIRIKAIQAAKDKAIYLLEAIGGTCGKPLYIEERLFSPQPLFSNISYQTDKQHGSDLEFKKIKISITFDAKFEIL